MSKDTSGRGRKAATASRKAQASAKKQAGKAGKPLQTLSEGAKVGKPNRRTVDWGDAFLSVMRESGNVRLSCEAAGITRQALYSRLASDDDFARAMKDAREEATDRLEQEAWRRAHDGVPEPVFYQGEKVGVVQRYSDTLMQTLLKANRPAKYRERHSFNDEDVDNEIDGLLAQLAPREKTDPA